MPYGRRTMRPEPCDAEPAGSPDPTVSYPVVTERNLPGGVRCYDCDKPIHEGFPFTTHLVAVAADRVLTHISCVYCTACPDDSPDSLLPGAAVPGASG
jgi:hypothetical protein